MTLWSRPCLHCISRNGRNRLRAPRGPMTRTAWSVQLLSKFFKILKFKSEGSQLCQKSWVGSGGNSNPWSSWKAAENNPSNFDEMLVDIDIRWYLNAEDFYRILVSCLRQWQEAQTIWGVGWSWSQSSLLLLQWLRLSAHWTAPAVKPVAVPGGSSGCREVVQNTQHVLVGPMNLLM